MSEHALSRLAIMPIMRSELRISSILDLHDIGDAFLAHIEDVTDEPALVPDGEPRIGGGNLGVNHPEEIDVICRQRVVERRLDRVAQASWPDQTRRDNDREIGLVLFVLRAAEQRAEHRDIAEPGQLILGRTADILQEAADDKALAISQ